MSLRILSSHFIGLIGYRDLNILESYRELMGGLPESKDPECP